MRVKTILIKIGGEVVASPAMAAMAADVRLLVDGGARVVLTHGGGPQATALCKRLGIEPRMVGGRRVTDEATLEVMKMVLAGQVNVDVCSALRRAGLRAMGLANVVDAVLRPPRITTGGGEGAVDFGLVGDVTGFDRPMLDAAWAAGCVPVVACLGHDHDGHVYNINADIVANQLAGALGAAALVLVTNTPGVLADRNDPSTRIARLTIAEGQRAIADGTVQGGMIPKLEESFATLALGVGAIYIVDGEIARAIREPGAVGTLIVSA